MSDEPTKTDDADAGEEISEEALAEQERSMAALLRGARSPLPSKEQPRILPGVQRKLRDRSKGKFFGDGWSTSQARVSYGLIALIMLVIIAVAYFVLGPTGFST